MVTTIYSLYGANEQVFVGGGGNDTYKIEQPGFMTVFDGGYSGKDVVQATGIGVYNDSTWVATIEGRHLWAYDEYSDQGIIVSDFMSGNSEIESIKLKMGHTYDQIIDAVYVAPNSLGDVGWDVVSNYGSATQSAAQLIFTRIGTNNTTRR